MNKQVAVEECGLNYEKTGGCKQTRHSLTIDYLINIYQRPKLGECALHFFPLSRWEGEEW